MFKNRTILFLSAVLLLFSFAGALKAESHLIIEQTRKYMGQVYPKRITNVWISENAFSIRSLSNVIIYRRDLGKVWHLLPFKNRYYEQDIAEFEKSADPVKEKISVHKLGQNYTPEYNWILKPGNSDETVNGYECKKFVALGDADFADDKIEIWGPHNSPLKLDDLAKKALMYYAENNYQGIVKLFPELNNYLIVKLVERINNSIAPEIINETLITKIEETPPNQTLYELPKGCTKVNSIDDLYK